MISKQTAPLFAGAGALRSSRGEPESEYPPPFLGGGAKNEARGEGVILWIHDCLYAPLTLPSLSPLPPVPQPKNVLILIHIPQTPFPQFHHPKKERKKSSP